MTDDAPVTYGSTVEVRTYLGATYTIPDVDPSTARRGIPESGRRPASMHSFSIYNVSSVVLVVPFHIIKEILVDGEVKWASPA